MDKMLQTLIVEDSQDDADLLVRALRRDGFQIDSRRVDTADSLNDALERQSWDLVLADFTMPGFSGTQALAMIRERGLDMPFIFVSGTMGEDIAVDALRNGAQDFLVKGNLARLGPAIERSLREVTVQRERRQAQEKLRQLYLAVEASANFIVITDADGTIQYVNAEVCRKTGFAAEELIGAKPSIWKSGATTETEYRRLWKTILTGRQWAGEFVNRCKDGGTIKVSATISPVRDESNTITHFVGIEEDVTERHTLEEQLRHSQKIEAIGQLTGGIAHDFNNLLAVMIGNLELLRNEVVSNERALKLADVAFTAGMRGAELTRHLLAFARRQPLDVKVFDPCTLARETVQLLSRTLGERIRTELAAQDDVWPVLADPTQVQSALMNLAINSRDAMPDGGRLTISVANMNIDDAYPVDGLDLESGEYVLFAVADTGTGIPPEIMERIFEPFVTTKESGEGTGLGLSTVHGFAKQSGGDVTVSTELGHGTIVRLYLPRAAIGETASDIEVPAELHADFAAGTVLCVEDDPDVRAVVVEQLRTLGYDVIEAPDGPRALEILRSTEHIDLLFTDVVMREMSGLELSREAHRLRPGLPVLLTSGFAEGSAGEDLPREVLNKPYRMTELATAVRRTIEKK